MGQKNFLKEYRNNFMQVFGTESEKELINHIRGQGNKNGFHSWAA
jgi:hypothetical protein